MNLPQVLSSSALHANDPLSQKISLDNLFRLALSLCTFAIAAFLWVFHNMADIQNLLILLVAYNIPYALMGLYISHKGASLWMNYFLDALDIAAITLCIQLTGGTQSFFFYLYILPFLVAAFHFEPGLVVWNGLLAIVAYLCLLTAHHEVSSSVQWGAHAGQLIFLGMVITTAVALARLLKRKDRTVQKSVDTLEKTVGFLNELGKSTIDQAPEVLQAHIIQRLNQLLKPLQTHARLWIANDAWKTLQGMGEHPALRPGSANHLPMIACPAFSLRRAFTYSQSKGDAPCASEQFNYDAHLCLPIATDKDVYGVLFLGTYEKTPWDSDDVHFFETLAQSIAFTLQRKALLERLQEKIQDLNFSFEVGASSLATFVGSTHSLDETTVHILDGVLAILKADRASLMLWDAATQRLQTQWVRGGDFKIQSPLQLEWGQGMAGWALKVGEPYWAEYALGDPHYQPSAQPIKSLLCVPIFTIDRQPVGVINVVTKDQPRRFHPREIDFLKAFGQQAALAIENAQLHDKNRANIEQLRELDKMKSQFLSLVSHDLRGPLTGIQGFCDILKQKGLTTVQSDLLEQMERQVDLQQRMVDDLLDLARMERGLLSIRPKPTDLLKLIKEEINKSQAEARDRNVTLSFVPPPMSSPPPVSLDEARIRQVLWNLIHNALKFTPEGGRVTVQTTWEGDSVRMQVSDTGVGLPPEAQERIFDKFFQVSPGGSKGSQGLGLGLAICKEIVSAHHGKITAFSPGLGQGTVMLFTLPLSPTLPVAAAAPPPNASLAA